VAGKEKRCWPRTGKANVKDRQQVSRVDRVRPAPEVDTILALDYPVKPGNDGVEDSRTRGAVSDVSGFTTSVIPVPEQESRVDMMWTNTEECHFLALGCGHILISDNQRNLRLKSSFFHALPCAPGAIFNPRFWITRLVIPVPEQKSRVQRIELASGG
jgi:hypothetical protein